MAGADAAVLALRGVSKAFETTDGRQAVLDDVGLEVGSRDLLAIVGESGIGKTTLLRIMAGLERPTAGEVRLAGVPIERPEPQVCLVFQHYASTLLPWKRAVDNVLFGMRARGAEARRFRDTALALLERMGLDAAAAGRHPWELSGGMQQRVVLARALMRRPRVLLLDEPFSAVDERTRAGLEELLLSLHREQPCSIVLVTHDLEQAQRLADRIAVLAGRPARIGRIVERPDRLTREALRSHLSLVRSATQS